ncbi:tRNA adenosine(34) deaminase TadA [Dermatophilus congolensis]|uniref:tRNA-specific adenosine deaminase n=1 Tax=Dermatophilus congolensis TaxID=1863 RepID=A0A239VC16_9MICO|nr:tRNA-specific adenosine deaminase [Dermatophilus congolensis]
MKPEETPQPVGEEPTGFTAALADHAAMRTALELARKAAAHSDIPVGALVLDQNQKILGHGRNTRELEKTPTGHAEIVALTAAAKTINSGRLDGCTLVVTLEPCVMCAGAAMSARIARIVFGAWDDKAGACGSVWDLPRDPRALHRIETIGGLYAHECAHLLTTFFEARR